MSGNGSELASIMTGILKAQMRGQDVQGADDPRVADARRVHDVFMDTTWVAAISATTHTGSSYVILLTPGETQEVTHQYQRYVCRKGSVTLNGTNYSGDHIRIGYNWNTRTILVFDFHSKKLIRRSSTIREFTIAN